MNEIIIYLLGLITGLCFSMACYYRGKTIAYKDSKKLLEKYLKNQKK
jgi:hypothetical protein